MRIGAVVVAAGYGFFRKVEGTPFPKVLEQIGGQPMIVHVINTVLAAGLSPFVLVLNELFGVRILQAVEWSHLDGTARFALQPKRAGSADAVMCALPFIRAAGADQVLVIYADMPLWSPRTILKLIERHLAEGPTISLMTVFLDGHHPKGLERYGRVIRDQKGAIFRIVEPADASPRELATRWANPSLWIWDLGWFADNVIRAPFFPKSDGGHPERYMPPLVRIARQQGRRIVELPLQDAEEALGVNTKEELETVRDAFARRNGYGRGSMLADFDSKYSDPLGIQ